MRKKVLTYLVCGALIVAGLCGCGTEQTGGFSSEPTQGTTTEESVQQPSMEKSTQSEESKESSEESSSGEEQIEITIADISSTDLVADMKIGWSLGNTLDATGGIALDSERSWGNPKTTKEMIDAVVDAGFNVIRIPISWENHFGPAPEYKIHDEWLGRVQEVVDYAYERDVYVIINLHHEDWHFPSEENKEAASEILTALWTQIAEQFKEYDEHLIFEGLNEPRKKGTPMEWNGGDMEGRSVVNHFAQVFVDAVRATGGNNELRHLMVTGYAASSSRDALESIVLPKDDKLIVSVHAYTPYNFALNPKGTDTWDVSKDAWDIDKLMTDIDELFLQKGVPVIIGEFGAVDKDNDADRIEWVTYYLSKAKELGVPCCWWDNNAFDGSGENFGLFDRRSLTFPPQELLRAMMDAIE